MSLSKSTPTRKLRVMIVDDSALIRELISDALTAQSGFEVVAKARNGQEALQLLEKHSPDVVTLDIQMPGMDGLTTLDEILKRRPLPVIMVSALTTLGANHSLDALDRGAMDYVAKPDSIQAAELVFRDELPRKLRLMGTLDAAKMIEHRKARTQRMQQRVTIALQEASAPKPIAADPQDIRLLADKCVAIGISTGGPPALTSLFSQLLGPMPPIVIVQHMPAQFTKPFAWRLNSLSPLNIKEAEHGDVLAPNGVYVAPGGRHLSLQRQGTQVRVVIHDQDPVSGHRPSVDVMMAAAAKCYGVNCLGMIMTGMGRDGSNGCRDIRAAGGYVLGQDEGSSDVYGMNKVAMLEGNVDKQFSLEDASQVLTQNVKRLFMRPALVTR